jgi:hypothetical protein
VTGPREPEDEEVASGQLQHVDRTEQISGRARLTACLWPLPQGAGGAKMPSGRISKLASRAAAASAACSGLDVTVSVLFATTGLAGTTWALPYG